MISIVDNDELYFKWIKENPEGYDVNSYKKPLPSYLVVHRATCRTIVSLQSRHKSFTKDYCKTCSNELDSLKKWAREEIGGELHECRICFR